MLTGTAFLLTAEGYQPWVEEIDVLKALQLAHAGFEKSGVGVESFALDALALVKRTGLHLDATVASDAYTLLDQLWPEDVQARALMYIRWTDLVRSEFNDLDQSSRLLARAEAVIGEMRDQDLANQAKIEYRDQEVLIAIEAGLPDLAIGSSLQALVEAELGLSRAIQLEEEGQDPYLTTARINSWLDALRNRLAMAQALDRYDLLEETIQRARQHLGWQKLAKDYPLQRAIAELRFIHAYLRIQKAGVQPQPSPTGEELGEARLIELAAADSPLVDQPSEHRRAIRLLGDLRLEQGRYEEARSRYTRLLGDVPEGEAQRRFLGARMASLERLDAGGRKQYETAIANLEDAWISQLNDWAELPPSPSGFATLHFEAQMSTLEELALFDLSNAEPGLGVERCLERLSAQQAVGGLARRWQLKPPSVAELKQGILAPGRLVLAFQPGRDQSFVFWMDGDSSGYSQLPAYDELDRVRREFLVAISRSALEDSKVPLVSAAEEATGAFLPPAIGEAIARADAIWVAGLDGTGYVPIELLLGPDGLPLGLAHTVGYLPSLPAGVHLAGICQAPAPGTDVALVACADPGEATLGGFPGIQSLDFSSADADRWLGVYGPAAGSTYLQEEASLGAFGAVCREQPRLLQLLAHGVPHPELPIGRGLALAGAVPSGGGLWPEDLYAMSDSPPFVILTACGLWDAPTRRGEDGSTHLGGAFLAAGARCVLMSWADLGLEEARNVQADLHAALSSGASMERALLQARQACWNRAEWGPEAVQSLLVHAFGWPASKPFPELLGAKPSREGFSPLSFLATVPGVAGLLLLGFVVYRLSRKGLA